MQSSIKTWKVNFCFSSDARFPSDQPIKIFDRVEIGEVRA